MEHAIHQRQLEHFTACYWIVSQFVGEIADADSRLQGTPFIGQARKPYFTTPQKIEPDKLPKQDWRYSSIISKSDEPLSTRYLPRGNGITLPPAFEEDGLLQTFQHIHTATLLQARMLEAIENLEPTLAETERQLRDAAEQTKPKNAKGAAAGAEPDSLFAGEGEPHLSFRQRLFSHIPGLRRGR